MKPEGITGVFKSGFKMIKAVFFESNLSLCTLLFFKIVILLVMIEMTAILNLLLRR